MRLFIDADACPVVDLAHQVAKKYQIPMIIVCDTSHFIERLGAETFIVQKGMDAVDFVIANKVKQGDVVITQDYGLAAMILAKRAYAINQNGFVYTEDNIEQLLFRRHVVKVARKSGARLKGPKKRTAEDDKRFKEGLTKLFDKLIEYSRKEG